MRKKKKEDNNGTASRTSNGTRNKINTPNAGSIARPCTFALLVSLIIILVFLMVTMAVQRVIVAVNGHRSTSSNTSSTSANAKHTRYMPHSPSHKTVTSSNNRSRSAITHSVQSVMDDRPQELFWFIHVSDIHLCRYTTHEINHFKQFVRSLPNIAPAFVIVTGDLVEAKDRYKVNSRQYVDEWETYRKILDEANITSGKFWHDVRGNHDNFNVPNFNSTENYYIHYSNSRQVSYSFTHETSFGNYTFISIDASPQPGPSRPFNFFGIMDKSDMDFLQEQLERSKDHNHVFVFGHYPFLTLTFSETTDGKTIWDLASSFSVYLCGHLHTLYNWVTKMYRLHDNFLELEVGDLRDSKVYRIIAVDHDLLSFTDTHLGEWPVILITNPKNAEFLLPTHENVQQIIKSTHVRALIFSPGTITHVTVKFDDNESTVTNMTLSSDHEHLYIAPWNPALYQSGLHKLEIVATDGAQKVAKTTHYFSVDGTPRSLFGMGPFLLGLPLLTMFKMLFYIGVTFVLFFIIMGYCLRNNVDYAEWRQEKLGRGLSSPISLLFVALLDVCTHTTQAMIFVIYGIYISVGPWFIAELIRHIPDDKDLHYTEPRAGMFFIHGLYLQGEMITSSETWFYGFFDVVTLYTPLFIYIALSNFTRSPYFLHKSSLFFSVSCQLLRLVVLVSWALHLFSVWNLYKYYGWVSVVISPGKSWWNLTALYLLFFNSSTQLKEDRPYHIIDREFDSKKA